MSDEANGPVNYRKGREGGGDEIVRLFIPTRGKNELYLFYNPANDLVVVDLIHGDEDKAGGNEIFRKRLNEDKLLKHLE